MPVKKKAPKLSAEERAAMREHLQDLKAGKDNNETAVLAKIRGMAAPDRALAEKVHAIVKASAPEMTARLWYGMPAYAKNDKVVCFFQDAAKFKARYATLGFSDKAALDDGAMWPSAFALTKIGPTEEAKIATLVKRAFS